MKKIYALMGIMVVLLFSGCVGDSKPIEATSQAAASVHNATVLFAGENTAIPGLDIYKINVTGTNKLVRIDSRYAYVSSAVVTFPNHRQNNYTVVNGKVTVIGATTGDLVDAWIYGH